MVISGLEESNKLVYLLVNRCLKWSTRIRGTFKNVDCFCCSMLKQWIKRKKRGTKKEESKPRWEADYELVENEGLFQEYLEMSKCQE